jgi:hypothetical protein
MKNQNKDYHLIQIECLERDIRIISDILEGRLKNYTKHPIPVLCVALSNYQDKLSQLRQGKSCEKGVV